MSSTQIDRASSIISADSTVVNTLTDALREAKKSTETLDHFCNQISKLSASEIQTVLKTLYELHQNGKQNLTPRQSFYPDSSSLIFHSHECFTTDLVQHLSTESLSKWIDVCISYFAFLNCKDKWYTEDLKLLNHSALLFKALMVSEEDNGSSVRLLDSNQMSRANKAINGLLTSCVGKAELDTETVPEVPMLILPLVEITAYVSSESTCERLMNFAEKVNELVATLHKYANTDPDEEYDDEGEDEDSDEDIEFECQDPDLLNADDEDLEVVETDDFEDANTEFEMQKLYNFEELQKTLLVNITNTPSTMDKTEFWKEFLRNDPEISNWHMGLDGLAVSSEEPFISQLDSLFDLLESNPFFAKLYLLQCLSASERLGDRCLCDSILEFSVIIEQRQMPDLVVELRHAMLSEECEGYIYEIDSVGRALDILQENL